MKFKLFKKSKDIPKVLVLGSSNSGKSTIVQQMMMIDGYLFKIGEREELKIKLVKQAVDSLKILMDICIDKEWEMTQDEENLIYNLSPQSKMSPHEFKILSRFLKKGYAKKALVISHFYNITTNAEYVIRNLPNYISNDYRLTTTDILLLRQKTESTVETELKMKGGFRVYDFGGERQYRKTWKNYFELADVIVFVSDISAFDEYLDEDKTISRLDDSLDLFSYISKDPVLSTLPITVLLNKVDLLQKKLGMLQRIMELKSRHVYPSQLPSPILSNTSVPSLMSSSSDESIPYLSNRSYQNLNQSRSGPISSGPAKELDLKSACKYFQKQFEERLPTSRRGKVEFYVTSATSSNNMDIVCNTVLEQVMKSSLTDYGLF